MPCVQVVQVELVAGSSRGIKLMVMAIGMGILRQPHYQSGNTLHLFFCGCCPSHIFVPLDGVDFDVAPPEGSPKEVSFDSSAQRSPVDQRCNR